MFFIIFLSSVSFFGRLKAEMWLGSANGSSSSQFVSHALECAMNNNRQSHYIRNHRHDGSLLIVFICEKERKKRKSRRRRKVKLAHRIRKKMSRTVHDWFLVMKETNGKSFISTEVWQRRRNYFCNITSGCNIRSDKRQRWISLTILGWGCGEN